MSLWKKAASNRTRKSFQVLMTSFFDLFPGIQIFVRRLGTPLTLQQET